MLKPAVLSSNTAKTSFLKLWTNRYKLDTYGLISSCTKADLINVIEEKGRQKTVARALRWIRISSELAGLKTSSLFSYVPNVVSLEDSKKIAVVVEQIYTELLDIYQQQPLSSDWLDLAAALNNPHSVSASYQKATAIDLPAIEQIAIAVEPLVLKLQEQHLACQDRRAIGFMSTQFHFSTQILLSNLKPVEQVTLKPYLQFIEEQVCIPWQRICAAANRQPMGSSVLKAVETMLPQSEDIADDTFRQAVSRFSLHRSRRGVLTQPDVAASFVRDINMFQAYLWLCVLEDSMSSVESELLPLCVTVFPAISVDWQLVDVSVDIMIEYIYQRLDAEYIPLIDKYLQAMKRLFGKAVPHS
ncbi:MAG: hypothetical protein ACFB2W_00050 [Leptolyngbyaceae cyanobacterium]